MTKPNQMTPATTVNYADMKAMLAEAGFSLEILSPTEYAAAVQQARQIEEQK